MNASTQTPAHVHTLANTGMLAMRAANMCKRLGLQPRSPSTPAPKPTSKPAARKQASVRVPKPESADVDAPEAMSAFRVVVLVKRGEAQTHATHDVQAAGPRRAGKAARAACLAAGDVPVGVVATIREDAPKALWDAAA